MTTQEQSILDKIKRLAEIDAQLKNLDDQRRDLEAQRRDLEASRRPLLDEVERSARSLRDDGGEVSEALAEALSAFREFEQAAAEDDLAKQIP